MDPAAPAGFFVSTLVGVVLLLCCAIAAFAQDPLALDGEHVRVTSVKTKGNVAFTEEELTARLQTIASPSWITSAITFFTTPQSYLSSAALVEDSVTLVEYYRDRGYLFADVRYTIAIDTDARAATVLFAINEQQLYNVDTVIVRDSARLEPGERAQMERLLAPLAGKPYAKTVLRDSIGAAVAFLQDHGYRFAGLFGSPIIRTGAKPGTVGIIVTIDPGKKYRFGRTDIVYDSASRGRCFAENAVLFELEFAEGDVYDRSKVYRSEDNLRRLGVFENVRIDLLTAVVDTATRIAPTVVYLKMRREFDFVPDLIFNNDLGPFGIGVTAAVADHNIFCAAQDLSLSFAYEVMLQDIHQSKMDIYLKFLQPRVRLGDILDYRRTSMQALAGYSRTTYPFSQNKYGASVQLSIREATYTYLVPQIAFVHVQTNTTGLDSNTAKLFSTSELVSKQPNLLLSVALKRDATNSLFAPSAGSAGALTLKTNVLNTPYFGKIEATSKWYVPWGTQSVFAFRAHGGLIGRFGDREKDILWEEKFSAGGAYSVRGWALYELGYGIPDSLKTGYTLLEANAEWRYQWFQLPDSWISRVILNRLSHSFFIDIGQVWSERRSFAGVWPDMLKQLAIAFGFGLRYDTPVGPVRLDFGYKFFDPTTGEFPHVASFDSVIPFIHIVHPTLQLAVGNAF